MPSWVVCWERQSVEVVITLCVAAWCHAVMVLVCVQLGNVNKGRNDPDHLTNSPADARFV